MAKRTETERFKYRIIVFYREEDEGYIARIPELPGCSAFGKTPEEASKEVRVAAELWIKAARKMGREIPRPVDEKKYSGKFALRLPPSLQRELDFDAKEEGISLNQLITYKLAHEKGIEIPKRAASKGSSKKSMTRKNGRPIVA
jgi:predicted RNase H-like HicB family nuclease